jgi:hypothetical protein
VSRIASSPDDAHQHGANPQRLGDHRLRVAIHQRIEEDVTIDASFFDEYG